MNEYFTITDKASEKTSEIIEKIRKYFPVYLYKEQEIDTICPPPEKDYQVSFLKSYEPDEKHRGKSYDDFTSETDKKYMTARQYFLLVLHVWETDGKHLDEEKWTRTATMWSDGYLLYAGWSPDNAKLYATYGYRDSRNADSGPREQFYLDTLSSNSDTMTLMSSDLDPDNLLVSPELAKKILKIKEQDAIKLLKEKGYKIIKTITTEVKM